MLDELFHMQKSQEALLIRVASSDRKQAFDSKVHLH